MEVAFEAERMTRAVVDELESIAEIEELISRAKAESVPAGAIAAACDASLQEDQRCVRLRTAILHSGSRLNLTSSSTTCEPDGTRPMRQPS
eukprot:COSAG06_NODE_1150_length_10499_cov_45.337115_4_plen_91_part_00